jgi:hypothetical protein
MQQKENSYWNYKKLTDDKLKKLTKDSTSERIQNIRNVDYRLTYKQRQALCIYLASDGKFDDYTYFTEGNLNPCGNEGE